MTGLGRPLSSITAGSFPRRGDLAATDDGNLVGLAKRSSGIQQPFPHPIQRRAAAEDRVIAEFDLGKEQALLAARLLAFPFGEERGAGGQPLLTTAQQVARRRGIGQFLQSGRVGALQKGVAALLQADALCAPAKSEPMMLVPANAR